MSTAAAVRTLLDDAPMSRAQVTAVALTFLLSALDGYDVLSVTFAAPAITADWGIGKGALGIVLSAGLVGMALGAFLLAPLADLVGRRVLLLGSLGLMGVGMLLCAGATSIGELAGWRVVAGLGIGACVAVIDPVAAEFANRRRRPLTVPARFARLPARPHRPERPRAPPTRRCCASATRRSPSSGRRGARSRPAIRRCSRSVRRWCLATFSPAGTRPTGS